MRLYNYLYSGFYSFFTSIKDYDPKFGAICFIAIAQVLHIAILIGVIEIVSGKEILKSIITSKILIILIVALVLVLNYFYYSKKQVAKIAEKLGKQTGKEQVLNLACSFGSILIPLIIIISRS